MKIDWNLCTVAKRNDFWWISDCDVWCIKDRSLLSNVAHVKIGPNKNWAIRAFRSKNSHKIQTILSKRILYLLTWKFARRFLPIFNTFGWSILAIFCHAFVDDVLNDSDSVGQKSIHQVVSITLQRNAFTKKPHFLSTKPLNSELRSAQMQAATKFCRSRYATAGTFVFNLLYF